MFQKNSDSFCLSNHLIVPLCPEMKRLFLYLMIIGVLTACQEQRKAPTAESVSTDATKTEAKGGMPILDARLTTEVLLKTTPVKDQGHSSLCWIYAMLATIETEHLMQGDSVDLSADYVTRKFLHEQAAERFMIRNKTIKRKRHNTDITTRGVGSMLLRLIQTYGVERYYAYNRQNDCNMNVLCRHLEQVVDTSPTLEEMNNRVEALMDSTIGLMPNFVFMEGVEYTPLEFAHSVCRDDEYESLTSFTHHPFGKRVVLEVPDNRYHDTYLNVPIDTLMNMIERSLRSGHPVCWEGDTSEEGFSFAKGLGKLTDSQTNKIKSGQPTGKPSAARWQQCRQYDFEMGKTTDDHCMEIVGIAHDKKGHRFYICKNSWGTINPYGGFMYLSENYVRLKTIAVFIPKAGIKGKP